MKAGSFFKYVEIQTKAASMIPFALGTVYALYRFNTFSFRNFILMFVSLLSFDMTTTAINNYLDFKKAYKKHGYGFEKHNAIVRDNIREGEAVAVILVLGITAVAAGVLLYLNTDVTVLLLGMLSFAVGVVYTAGPVPISRTPLGEIFSGFFMGFVIPFLSVYIHAVDDRILSVAVQSGAVFIKASIRETVRIFMLSVPSVTGIANIMLANNICDMEDDWENRRFTLPVYIGRKKALSLFRIVYFVSFVSVFVSVVSGILPAVSLLFFLTAFQIRKNVNRFMEIQTKKDTFPLAVENFAVMNISLIFSIIIAIVKDMIIKYL